MNQPASRVLLLSSLISVLWSTGAVYGIAEDETAAIQMRRIRIRAMLLLKSADEEAIEFLRESLKEDDIEIRVLSAQVLEKFSDRASEAVVDLIGLLEDRRRDKSGELVWAAASKALSKIGKPALPELDGLMDDTSGQRYYSAAVTIFEMGPVAAEMAPRLMKNIDIEEPANLWITIKALGVLGEASEPAIPRIIEYLDHESFQIQIAACDALAMLGPASTSAVPRLLKLLDDGVTSCRGHAALALGRIGPVEGKDLIGPLLAHAAEFNDTVRNRCLLALKQLGPKAASTSVPRVQELMNNPKYPNRVQAADTLWTLTDSPTESIRVLVSLLDNPEFNLEAIYVLQDRGAESAPAVEGLVRALKSNDFEVRSQSAAALESIGPAAAAAMEPLEDLLINDPEQEVRVAADRALRSIRKD